MAHKTWDELYKQDVTEYVKQRDGTPYVPWGRMVKLLHEAGYTKVFFNALTNPDDGSSIWHSNKIFTDKNGNTNSAYEVRIEITLGDETDEETFTYSYPITSGITPVRDNLMNQNRVATSVARGFTKAVAIKTGLSFKLWADIEDEEDPVEDLSKHQLWAIKQRMQEEYTLKLKKAKMSTKDIADKLEMTEDEVKLMFSYPDMLERFEKKLVNL